MNSRLGTSSSGSSSAAVVALETLNTDDDILRDHASTLRLSVDSAAESVNSMRSAAAKYGIFT